MRATMLPAAALAVVPLETLPRFTRGLERHWSHLYRVRFRASPETAPHLHLR